jgi:hypothetical protein
MGIMEHAVRDTETPEQNFPRCHFVPHKSSAICRLNTSRHVEKPTTNSLSYELGLALKILIFCDSLGWVIGISK